MADQRSPFGELLRYHRRRLGMSQEGLAKHILDLGDAHSDIAALGVIGEKAIANLEKFRPDPAGFVRPRPATVRLLSVVFELKPGTDEYTAFWRAAGLEAPQPEAESHTNVPLSSHSPMRAVPPLLEGREFVTNGRELQLARLIGAIDEALTGQPSSHSTAMPSAIRLPP